METDIKNDGSTSGSGSLIGSLWQRNENSTWDRVYCQADELMLHILSSDGKTQTKSLTLRTCTLREVTFSNSCASRHSTGFLLTSSLSNTFSREGSPRAVTDLSGNSVSVILAADNSQDHYRWLEILASKCEYASFVTTPHGMMMQSFTPLARSIQSSAAPTSSASSSSSLAGAVALGGKRRGSRKSAMPCSFWSSRIAI